MELSRRKLALFVLVAVASIALVVQQVYAEIVPPTVTEIPNPVAVGEHEYHWWDVLTSRASGYLAPNADKVDNMIDRAQRSASKAGGHITDNAANLGKEAADNVKGMTQDAKREAGWFGGQARHAAKQVKQAANYAQEEVNAQGRRAAQNAEDTLDEIYRQEKGLLHRIYDRFVNQARNVAAATRGAGGQLRTELRSGLVKLGDMVGALGHSASPLWPEAVFDGTRDPIFSKYISELGQVSKQANAQIRSKLDTHSEILENIVRSHLSSQLPLASCYAPVLALLLIYLVNSLLTRKADLRNRIQLQRIAAASGRNNNSNSNSAILQANQQECALASDTIATSCAYLIVVPMTIVLLVIMETSGMAGWLITSSYTCLIAGTVAAMKPSFLVNVFDSNDIENIGQRLAIGITTITAVSCLLHSAFG
ncbi:hypothetical protein COEREDRAFT_82745 [Coemansia reversa NRRL 1564]|uniref:Uncharacterized protein n=1 Tax=Coemansia reversa (strain ATCC 12441 / NRRL 1564) TaxID=763665 RepID=A0A2G5B649_COERN|nr:hypothetical protein COEREDRAFT_82745 [Coemansia reversa NRRL 1564]|eukprot:PIA14474.1 hypothetical protein COEREDRAFT_82745 [Coemansia reversa NRRL 1564]